MKHFEKSRGSRGFTLLEIAVVLAVIAILAAILTPIITSYVNRARQESARNDLKNIAAAVTQFNTDSRFWPIYVAFYGETGGSFTDANSDANIFQQLTTADGLPATIGAGLGGAGLDVWPTFTTETSTLDAVLNSDFYNSLANYTYKGPYMTFGADPWGTKYYVTAGNLKPGSTDAAFVLSAGPDQTINTDFSQARGTGAATVGTSDDLIVQIR